MTIDHMTRKQVLPLDSIAAGAPVEARRGNSRQPEGEHLLAPRLVYDDRAAQLKRLGFLAVQCAEIPLARTVTKPGSAGNCKHGDEKTEVDREEVWRVSRGTVL